MTTRACVFCGKRPNNGTKEHVIPRWLIQLTGALQREATFGPFLNVKTGKLEFKKFAFDTFSFPACKDCNNTYSRLESDAKVIMQDVLAGRGLSCLDIELLLTWLDKVRVGSWLASYSMLKDPFGFAPLFHINWRVNACDRMVLIYRTDFKGKRVTVLGSTLAFQLQPSCFCLVVNDYFFINASTDFLVSERLGLPYASHLSYTDTAGLSVSVAPGRKRIRAPLVRLEHDQHCTQIFQPMFTRTDIRTSFPLYETEYVKSVSRDHLAGIGKVFIMDPPFVEEYPSYKSKRWIPKWTWDDNTLFRLVRRQLLEAQMQLLEYGACERKVSFSDVKTKKQRDMIVKRMQTAKEVNRLLLQRDSHD